MHVFLLALHATCSNDAECIEDAYCVQRNSTMGRRCYCRDGFYEESPLICNGKFHFSLWYEFVMTNIWYSLETYKEYQISLSLCKDYSKLILYYCSMFYILYILKNTYVLMSLISFLHKYKIYIMKYFIKRIIKYCNSFIVNWHVCDWHV